MQTVPDTILEQLGGNRFVAMTGATQFVGSDDSLKFKLPRGTKGGITHMQIKLNAADTYDITTWRWNSRALEMKAVGVVGGIFAEDLRRTFTDLTGLDTSL